MRGGTEIVGWTLLRGLRGRGVVVRALAPVPESLRADDGDGPSEAVRAPWIARYRVPTFSSLLADGSSDPEYRAAERRGIVEQLPSLLQSARPQVIVVGRESLAWDVPAIATAHGVPTVLIVHGGATLAGILEAQGEFEALRRLLHSVDRIVGVAAHIATSLRRLGLTHVSVIGNPVDVGWFGAQPDHAICREALSLPAHATVVLHVSNLTRLKRPLDFVEAADLALRRDGNLRFVVVGDGALRAAMETAVARARRTAEFRFVGWVDHARVRDYISLANIVVMPSEREGQSLVYLETQAAGKVLVASDIAAAREVIVDGETGVLFRRGATADLAATIVALAADPSRRAMIGTKARAAVRCHASDIVVSDYARLLADAVGQPRCRLTM
jgi:glycosyltransferase involved in cell wall biosynthesis